MVGRGLPGALRRRQRVPGRMAGAGRGIAARAGYANRIARRTWRSTPQHRGGDGAGTTLSDTTAVLSRYSMRAPRGTARARFASLAFLFALFAPLIASAATEIVSARLWPAPEYTRLTLEAQTPITHNVFTIAGPDRLVLDLEEVEAN